MAVPTPKFDLGVDMPSSPTIKTIPWSRLKAKARDQNTIGLCRAENFKQQAGLELGDHTEKDGSHWIYLKKYQMRLRPEVNIYLAKEMNKDSACKSYVLEHEKHHYKDYKVYAKKYTKGLHTLLMREELAIKVEDGMTHAQLKGWAKQLDNRLHTVSKTYSQTFFQDMMRVSASKRDTNRAYRTAYDKCKACLGLK